MPVFLENRPNAAALAESTIGAGSDYRNLIYLTTGRGVGAGVICDGKIFQGSYGGAGEIGKSIVFSRDDFMGRKLEVDLEHRMRASYLSEKASAVKGRRVSYSELLELYHEADPGIDRLICENAEYLACAASVICNFYNPEALILGGRKKELGARYLDYFKSVFDRHQANPVTGRTNVILSRFGRDGVAIGGAVIIIEKLLNLELN
jgi:predicted NBD/HSP70 family sugar kinase